MDDELLVGVGSALAEAKLLHGMLLRGTESVQELRELMAVPPKIGKVLRAYMKESPEDAWWIERAIKFRQKVLAEFNRLVDHVIVGQGVEEPSPDLPDGEEAGSGPVAEAPASVAIAAPFPFDPKVPQKVVQFLTI